MEVPEAVPEAPTITLTAGPEGLSYKSNVPNTVMALGMLELGKTLAMDLAKRQQGNPGLLLANRGLPKMNGG